ncbi:hypothetical protein CBR_g50430, partial [Chara braunii]
GLFSKTPTLERKSSLPAGALQSGDVRAAELTTMFNSRPFIAPALRLSLGGLQQHRRTGSLGSGTTLDIDDIDIGDDFSFSQSWSGKAPQNTSGTHTSGAHTGKLLSAAEVRAKYQRGKPTELSGSLGQSKERLMERQEKLEVSSLS